MKLKKKNAPAQPEQNPAGKEQGAPAPRRKNTKRRLLIAGACAAVLLLALLAWGALTRVPTETLAAAPFADSFTETGIVTGGPAREYLSPVSGRIAEVPVRRNSAVKAGDVLLRIDASELEYELQSHRNALEGYRAKVNETIRDLRGELSNLEAERSAERYDSERDMSPEAYLASLRARAEAARTRTELAEKALSDARELYEIGAESRAAVEEAEAALKEARAESATLARQCEEAARRLSGAGTYHSAQDESYAVRMQTVQETLDDYLALAAAEDPGAEVFSRLSIGKQIAEETSQIRMLEEKLERCTVRANGSGYVSSLPAETLSSVTEGDPVVVVRESAALTLVVNVLTSEEPFLRVGDAVTLTQKRKGEKTVYEGAISEIGNYADKGLSATGAEEYRVRVVVALPEDAGLKEGYELEARFTTYRSDAALTVPNSALFKVNGQDCVFVVSGLRAEARPVVIAHKAAIRTEIASGIQAGDRIVTDANLEDLEDGALVIAESGN